jgi:Tfp pilus assembly protein PilF
MWRTQDFNVKHHIVVRMANLTPALSQALSRAISACNAGELVEAEQLCQQIINAKRDLFDALHLLALVQTRLGKKDKALASYDRASSNRFSSCRATPRLESALP